MFAKKIKYYHYTIINTFLREIKVCNVVICLIAGLVYGKTILKGLLQNAASVDFGTVLIYVSVVKQQIKP